MEYKEILQTLIANNDKKTSVFNKKIISTKYEILGLKLPYLRDYAQSIVQSDMSHVVLNNNKFTYYEEIMLYGFVLAKVKISELERIKIIDKYIDLFDNWSNVDSFCASLKSVKKNKQLYFDYIKKCVVSNDSFRVRFGVVLLMDYYLHDFNLSDVFKLVISIKSDDYYIQMALAWFFATSFALNYDQTLVFVCANKNEFDKIVLKKMISKCNDSYRLSAHQKSEIKKIL